METQVLLISSTTTPALVSASYNASTSIGWGRQRTLLIAIQATRAHLSAMTAVKFEVQGSRDGSTGWTALIATRLGDSTATAQQEAALTVADATTANDFVSCSVAQNIPFIRVVAKSVTADAGAGDSAAAWVELTR